MGVLTPEIINQIKTRHQNYDPKVFVETGTYEAETVSKIYHMFDTVYSIELSKTFHQRVQSRYRKTGINFIQGDTTQKLAKLAAQIDRPALFYLDAHYWPRPGVAGKEHFPLWDELAILEKRAYNDIIIVDDIHCFGTTVSNPAWKNVSKKSIDAALTKIIDSAEIDDSYVLWRKS